MEMLYMKLVMSAMLLCMSVVLLLWYFRPMPGSDITALFSIHLCVCLSLSLIYMYITYILRNYLNKICLCLFETHLLPLAGLPQR